jgi:hypothetical protein
MILHKSLEERDVTTALQDPSQTGESIGHLHGTMSKARSYRFQAMLWHLKSVGRALLSQHPGSRGLAFGHLCVAGLQMKSQSRPLVTRSTPTKALPLLNMHK